MTLTTANTAVFPFEVGASNFTVTITTDSTGDCMEDIWNDICSYIYNVTDAEATFAEGIAEIFSAYPDYNYEIKEEA